eukprot:7882673-Prorocentrum_lima.AAC.1
MSRGRGTCYCPCPLSPPPHPPNKLTLPGIGRRPERVVIGVRLPALPTFFGYPPAHPAFNSTRRPSLPT